MDAIKQSKAPVDAGEMAVREILLATTSLNFDRSPPLLSGELQAHLRQITGCDDPFLEAKESFNRLALELLPPLAKTVRDSEDPFALAVKLAIAGNVIDLGAKSGLTEAEVRCSVAAALDHPLVGDIEKFRRSCSQAKRILYLADNAGEIVFDRVLLEQLPKASLTVAVRGRPVLNDATTIDARAAGIAELADVIDNGSDSPGTILERCSSEFRRRFREADLIIAKGQGNFESLCDEPAPLFCLFRVKCAIVAEHCGQPIGTHLVWQAPTGEAKIPS